MQCFYTDHFDLPLPEGHRFPMSKYRLLRQRIVDSPQHFGDVLIVPPAVTDEQLAVAHEPRYIQRVVSGTLSVAEQKRIGFPWSEKMVERSKRSSGATMAAARGAVSGERIAANLAGGTHHAFADAGEGYCVFNDAAVTLRALQRERMIRRAIVIDCDVHQGNGTASILQGEPDLLTFSIHGEKNFPLRKVPSWLDVELPDGCDDDRYLRALSAALETIWQAGPFDLAIYLAGADPFEGDRLGRLKLTKPGLLQRDRMVLEGCLQRRIPVAITMAGGYAHRVEDIVDIHAQTIGLASAMIRS
jgi:acetoin utilization deacetylase AcuC-like enzyme